MNELLQSAEIWLPGLLTMLGLSVVSGAFSGSETALFSLSHEDLRRFHVGSSGQRTVATLLADPDRLLTAILFWNLLVNLLYFAVSVVVTQRLTAAGSPVLAGVFAFGGVFGLILLGEVLPKSVAVAFPNRLAVLVAYPMSGAVRVLDPVLPLFRRLTRVLRRTLWPKVRRESHIDTDDLERAVETSPLSERARQRERIVLQNVLALSEITVEEVMRPRGTYVSLPAPVALEDLAGEVPASDYLLIREPDTQEIVAAVSLNRFSRLPTASLDHAAEDVVHVPWCAHCADTLQWMRERLCGVAVVVNEYGETIGIVTYEDLVDTVVVPEPSRARRLLRREPVVAVGENVFEAEGLTTLRHLAKRLELEFQPEEGEPVTVSGLLLEELRELPAVGDECTWNGCQFRVLEIGDRGRLRVRIERSVDDVATAFFPEGR